MIYKQINGLQEMKKRGQAQASQSGEAQKRFVSSQPLFRASLPVSWRRKKKWWKNRKIVKEKYREEIEKKEVNSHSKQKATT